MAPPQTTSQRYGWRVAAAALLPFAVQSAYVLLTRWPRPRFTGATDIASHVISILVGAWFVWRLPFRLSGRVVALLLYVPIVAALLFWFMLFLVIAVFGEAL